MAPSSDNSEPDRGAQTYDHDLDHDRQGGGAKTFSCYPCRFRKLKCDRKKPQCDRCVAGGEVCEFPAARKKPTITASRPRVKELEARLRELEYRLKEESPKHLPPSPPQDNAASKTASVPSIPPVRGDEVSRTGRLEQLPPMAVIEELTTIYFARIHPEMPMIHPSRYWSSLYRPPHMQPPMCLQYSILCVAAGLSPPHRQLAEPFYRRARYYLENDEMKGDGQDFITIAHLQAWVCVIGYEVQNMWFSRACMSASRAVRLSQIMGLDSLDGESKLRPTLLPPRDWCELEERRRTFWMVFMRDATGSSTTGWPKLINWEKIQTFLPASEEAFELGIEEPSVTLRQALSFEGVKPSVYAFRVLTVHLFHECLDLNFGSTPTDVDHKIAEAAFWKRYHQLDTEIAVAFVSLPDGLRCPANTSNPAAVLINVQLHTASMSMHRAGTLRSFGRPHLEHMTSRTKETVVPSAHEVFGIIAGIADIEVLFRNPFVPFACFMAGTVFLEDYMMNGSKESEARLQALMDLMLAVGRENQMTASLTVQLATELKKTGTDPAALDKVRELTSAMKKDMPLLARQDALQGTIVFCPFELKHAANYDTSAQGLSPGVTSLSSVQTDPSLSGYGSVSSHPPRVSPT